ncbi:hypothetical protein ASG93_17635 [Paenibacillus sp. Soil787]|nr:hypothetical protein ASG93_17635 [Paenibacillus sp. Soil787]
MGQGTCPIWQSRTASEQSGTTTLPNYHRGSKYAIYGDFWGTEPDSKMETRSETGKQEANSQFRLLTAKSSDHLATAEVRVALRQKASVAELPLIL